MNLYKLLIYALLLIVGFVFLRNQIYVSYLKKAVQQDIDFIQKTIMQYHPNHENALEPMFINTTTIAYQQAKNQISNVRNSIDHSEIIKYYLNLLSNIPIQFHSSTRISPVPDCSTTQTTTNLSSVETSVEMECHLMDLPSKIGQIQFSTKKN